MRLRIVLSLWLLSLIAMPSIAQTTPELPAQLRDWQGWVRYQQEYRACPLIAGATGEDASSYFCAWPDRLALQTHANGARFSQNWTLYTDTAVPLPGSDRQWPQSVRVDGVAAAVVVDAQGRPSLWLPRGSHRIDGEFIWDDRPESIAVDGRIAQINLTIDGTPVFPLQRDGDALWLGRADSGEQEADSLDVQVFRLLSDEVPQRLLTRLRLRVSGKGREEVLAAVLPAGFVPISLDGGLIARYESTGSLHVQVRPGVHELSLLARADKPTAEFSVAAATAPWPDSEIWSYQSQAQLRVTDASGPPQIDPVMAEVPNEWRSLPSFEMTAGAVLKINERSRGLSDQDQNRLSLSRELWLDYAGTGWTSKDEISGTLMRDWRLDLAPPYQLTRAEENGFALLVTKGAQSGWTGVEVRERQLQLSASTRLKDAGSQLPVTGWQHDFETVSTQLNFPPGYELIAAPGADRAPLAWLDRWDLLDVFLAALVVFLTAIALGRVAALIPLGYLLLAWHLPDAPRLSLMFAVAAILLAGAVRHGEALPRWLARLSKLLAIVLVVIAVPFAAQQIRQALYPQLEPNSLMYDLQRHRGGEELELMQVTGSRMAIEEAQPMVAMSPPPPPPPVLARMASNDGYAAASIGQSNRMPQKLKRYDSNTIVQAGGGEPSWRWRSYHIEIAGPVLPTQTVRLLISPPWMTRLARLTIALLLGLTLVMVLRAAFAQRRTSTAPLATTALCLLLIGGNAVATEIPSDELLDQLGARVLALPECAPQCGRIARAEVTASGARISATVELHAVERVALPLPGNEKLLDLQSLQLDGVAATGAVRSEDGTLWLLVPRGVHRATMEWRAANADSISLRFAVPPGRIEFSGEDWQASGIDEGQLATGSLELTRRAGDDVGSRAGVAQRFPAFVIVTRELRFDLDWALTTTVQRVSPATSAFSVDVPLLVGERVMSTGFQIDGKVLTVPFAENQHSLQWESRVDAVDAMTLTAPDQSSRAEIWRLNVSPTWNVQPSGVPAVHPVAGMYQFHPLPGEVLNLKISRPQAIAGNTLAIDSASISSRIGKRSSEHDLSFTLRATQGGQHPIDLPADAEVMELRINQQLVNIRPQQGKLSLPLTPGINSVSVKWRDGQGAGMRVRTPTLSLNADASNLDVQLNLPQDRWVIATSGPRVGPAVLYWGELLVMGLLAWGLSRVRRTPLRLIDWLLLGIGFSTVSWWALVIFVGWLFALDWRARLQPDVLGWRARFNFVQLGLVMLTIAAAIALFAAIRTGLLGTPDLHVVGNGSYAHALRWFDDQTAGLMPIGSAWTLPMWLYRALMLGWAFWMAWALIAWLRWGLQCFIEQGAWRPWFKPKPKAVPVEAATPTVDAAAANTDPSAPPPS